MSSNLTSLPPFDPNPTTLTGRYVELRPLERDHAAGLFEAGRDPTIWRYLPLAQPKTVSEMEAFIDYAHERQRGGFEVPFVTIERVSGRVAGTTRYLDIQRRHRGLEIGWTWISSEFQRTAVNTEAKLLQMRHAFEDLGAIRVCLKTDLRNERSQRAIERLGAQKEGVFRNHYIMPDGYVRDSVWFSIVDREWPDVRARLDEMLERHG
ncbi:MAG: GNAT family protein [Candidatus Hydrogenedentota bacterium]